MSVDLIPSIAGLFALAEKAYLDRQARPRAWGVAGTVKRVFLRPRGEIMLEIVFPDGTGAVLRAESVEWP
jgi:hypothetical protein